MSLALRIVRTVIVAPGSPLGILCRTVDAPADRVAAEVNALVRGGVLNLIHSPGQLNFALEPGQVEQMRRFAEDEVVQAWCQCATARRNPVRNASLAGVRRVVTAQSRSAQCTVLLDRDTWLDTADPDLRLLGELIERRALARLVVSARLRSSAPGTRLIRRVQWEGVKVRIARRVPAPMIHWHGHATLHLCPNSVAMRTLGDVGPFVDFTYERATPHAEISEQDLITQLASGATDEAAARALGISERHYRRRVSAIMTSLGAESRFQAGIEAAQHYEL